MYLVPAFTGLGAPWWDMYARGAMVGMTRGTTRAHVVRAALEAIAFQCADVLSAMEADAGIALRRIKVDGGASANGFLMQFQADLLDTPAVRPACIETTAMGAAYFAGLHAGLFPAQQSIASNWSAAAEYMPSAGSQGVRELQRGWRRAVERARNWLE
jgi:glycerol kinase